MMSATVGKHSREKRRCYIRQRFVQLVASETSGVTLCQEHMTSYAPYCAMILATCLPTATTEDSRESIERFNWLTSTNRCETSCTNHREGCHTGQCSKQSLQRCHNRGEK